MSKPNCHWLQYDEVVRHRHLNHERYTAAAIDDVISRGRWADWADMRRAALADPSLFAKIERVCGARASDRFAMRHRFWMYYAAEHRLAPNPRAA